ncbi:bifunctional UDP-N-acetylglucosamine diphosphorylase/glucosamine-1-phosphate N-acetyltransferase GlmU [Methyloradius palustris]|uniref:Bifunctional protein GlmU n=1 Tax=Methyloradius palustris TaxID=2778876 RepID=A0A8D5JS96_9PROT|nr:bifunctional UDP-N-acetylglucosamine diphosphorylase/glucosamine-1-phosphate N-acetyltransferase GlmU [Methyloradius palustris]BCM26231.1 bifunctional protein GlmU [Methyloradius palustris]
MPDSSSYPLNIVILAAGKGTRMHSSTPKVLHKLAGTSLLAHVINTAESLNPSKIIVVYGYGGEAVPQAFAGKNITWVKQTEQLGTGHAVQQTVPYLDTDATTLILLGDVPLVSADRCKSLIEAAHQQLALLTVIKPEPKGYGRIVRNEQCLPQRIVEEKDATEAERAIKEVNSGIIAVANTHLKNWLTRLDNNNAQREYYLTDIVAMAANDCVAINAEVCDDEWQVTGINSKLDLAAVERVYQTRLAQKLLQGGVTLHDPARLDIRGSLTTGQDVEIDVGCIFEGEVTLADGVKIGAYCVIKDASIGANTIVAPFSHIDQATIANDCRIGPYARIRPGTELNTAAHIGNFVEIKNSQIDTGSKVNHLSYVGDTTVGKNVNIGAGVITCNYDGVNKSRTVIGDNAFIGSDAQLIAPVTIGANATIGAGSTISKDAPAGELTVSRGRQVTVPGWKRPVKK